MKWLGVSIVALTITALLSLALYKLFNPPAKTIENIQNTTSEFTDIVFDNTRSNESDAEIRNLISQAQICNTANDCKKAYYGCPFGCSSLVNKENHNQILALIKIRNLSSGIRCKYRCIKKGTITTTACINNLCALVETIDVTNNIRQFIEQQKNN